MRHRHFRRVNYMRVLNIDFAKLKASFFSTDINIMTNEIQELSQIFRLKTDRYSVLDDVLESITNWKFATGGESVQRGFYSPLLYESMTIGGYNRGKLLKQVTCRSKVNYKYGFVNDKLVVALKYDANNCEPYTYEYIEYQEDIQIGIEFAINRGGCDSAYNRPIRVVVAQYEKGRLISTRILQQPAFRRNRIVDWDYNHSWYYYDTEGKLYKIENAYGSKCIMQHKIVTVICDEEGCPDKYFFDKNDIHKVSENNKLYYREMFLR